MRRSQNYHYLSTKVFPSSRISNPTEQWYSINLFKKISYINRIRVSISALIELDKEIWKSNEYCTNIFAKNYHKIKIK